MSKGDRHRSINENFKSNYDNIKWSGETKYANRSRQPKARSHHIMTDIEPYQAVGPEAGKVISSRSKEREYLKRHDLQQVGNEKDYFFKYDGKTPDNPTREW